MSEDLTLGKYRVVIRYNDPRGGTYYGQIYDTLEEAKKQLAIELRQVQGTAWIERV